MKINVGIVGFGKLGKALKEELLNDKKFNLVKIFSRRRNNNCEDIKNISLYKNKIDVLFLCVGSQSDLQPLALTLVKNFNLIDVYDNHSMLKQHISALNKKCKQYKKVCFSALGWDPGVLSLVRGLYFILGLNYITTWGKGVSQGHTNAIKNISGVIDAVQFTIPIKKQVKVFKKTGFATNKSLHLRKCYVVANRHERKAINKQIINMEHYFKDYKTKIKFVTINKLNKIKTDQHKGEIITQNNVSNFSLNLKSNPHFTANIMIVYAKIITDYVKNNRYGVHTILDIPLSDLVKDNKYKIL